MRAKAGARIKQMVATTKELEEEVGRLRELDELNQVASPQLRFEYSPRSPGPLHPEPRHTSMEPQRPEAYSTYTHSPHATYSTFVEL